MSYINPAPGTAGQVTLKIDVSTGSTTLGGTPLTVPALVDMTVKNANDTHIWSQLDSTAKYVVPTTATNEVTMNIVVDPATFFGTTLSGTTQTSTVQAQGIMGLSRNKTKIAFEIKVQDLTSTANDYLITGQGYITALAPAINATAPVWVTPLTIVVTGEYTVENTTGTVS
jgi:hypothetical protein